MVGFRCHRITAVCVAAAVSGLPALPGWLPQQHNTSAGGYAEEIPLIFFPVDTGGVQPGNIMQARLGAQWFPVRPVSAEASGRMLLYSGDIFLPLTGASPAARVLSDDPGHLDLTGAWSAILHGAMDRLWAGVAWQGLDVAIGRQRINWGIALVWNPNDWYNVYDYLDFSYEERPGTDAARITYHTGPVSSVEVALEAGQRQAQRTLAGVYRFNLLSYDFQVQAGLSGNDGAAGVGWAGDILGGGFRGEISYFHHLLSENGGATGPDTSGYATAVLSGDYTFTQGLYVHTEALYNGFGTRPEPDTQAVLSGPGSVRRLYPARYALFGEVSYSFTPLLRATLAGILALDDFSIFAGPSISWSVLDNVDLFIFAQVFRGEAGALLDRRPGLAAARVRYSF